MIWALLLAAQVNAATVQDSWLGTKADPTPAGTQFLTGETVYVHLVLKLGSSNRPKVQWFRNAKLVKTTNLAGTRKTAYSNISIRALPGRWTVVLTDGRQGFRRSHHFVVR